MLAKVISSHIDTIDELEERLHEEIDRAIAAIDIDAVIANPRATLNETAQIIQEKIIREYIEKALVSGREFAKRIQEKDVVVDLQKNPDKNEDVIK